MHILLLTPYFPPDNGSAANLFAEFGRALVARGHRVSVVTNMPSYHAAGDLSRYGRSITMRATLDATALPRLRVLQLARCSLLARIAV